jgi:hypothetical protein
MYTDLFEQALDYSHVSLLLGIPSWEENTINGVSLQKKMFILVLNTKRGASKGQFLSTDGKFQKFHFRWMNPKRWIICMVSYHILFVFYFDTIYISAHSIKNKLIENVEEF